MTFHPLFLLLAGDPRLGSATNDLRGSLVAAWLGQEQPAQLHA